MFSLLINVNCGSSLTRKRDALIVQKDNVLAARGHEAARHMVLDARDDVGNVHVGDAVGLPAVPHPL